MKRDIDPPLVKEIGLAIVREENEEGHPVWHSYLLNVKQVDIEGVIVASKGYGQIEHEQRKTAMLRHYIDELPAQSYRRIEPIIEEVFGMFNEYWLTFFERGKMYDRRFIFVPESISEENFTQIPLMGVKGVLIL
jgi:hypothetical protein